MSSGPDLRDTWGDLLRRRKALGGSLGIFGAVVERWAQARPAVAPLNWSSAECRACWARDLPLVAEAPPAVAPETVEALLGPALDTLAAVRRDAGEAIRRFVEAWDGGAVTPATLLPARGRVGALDEAIGLSPSLAAFLAIAGLRPSLEAYFSACRVHLPDDLWSLGVCPFCGAPPGFGDILEDGRRRLACHLCGGGWLFSRTRCPFCGSGESRDTTRLEPEGLEEGGYVISACQGCRGYLKELDRRVRWNAGPALVEDWGSPHLDLVAHRSGYWRPLPSLIELARPA